MQFVTIFYDEVLNDVMQKIWMGVSIRLFSISQSCHHRRSKNWFWETAATFLLTKRLQIPTEGSYVNQKFYSQFSEHLDDHDNTEIIVLGLCGFHVLHGAFQSGNRFVGQKLNDTLRVVYRLYKGSPTIY